MRSQNRSCVIPRSAAARRAGRGTLFALLAAIAVAPAACKKDDKANTYAPPPPPEVIVAKPVERDVVDYLTYSGVLEASEIVDLRARVVGFLEKINFQPGQKVKAGDLLFEIDPRQYQAAVNRAKAEVQSQKAALAGAENDARLARELADQRAGPEIDAIIKAARRDMVQADVAKAEANFASASLDLEYCHVLAPIDGRITKNMVDIGNLVGGSDATLLAQIVQAVPAYVSLDISESDVIAVRREREQHGDKFGEPGQISPGKWRPCELSLSDQGSFTNQGRVDYVAPQMNAETGTLRIRTRFENADESLLPGYFSRVRFPMSTRKAMLVPEAALLSDQQGRYALIVNPKGEVEMKRVQLGVLDGDQRVVREGLTPNDQVVVLGVLKARPGSKVTPKFQEPAAPGR